MKKTMTILSVVFSVLFIISLVMYLYLHTDIYKTLCISFGVTAYHFVMRLAVGYSVNAIFKNRMDSNKEWFREKPFERRIYKLLGVKKWKNRMPTFNEELFDIKKHSVEEIMGASCQAEVVHEIIIVLSFLPIILCLRFDDDAVFIITSVLAALFDSSFVIMQRYNRPRMKRFLDRKSTAFPL